MTTYFPYSEIIAEFCSHIDQNDTQSAYIAPWQLTGGSVIAKPRVLDAQISELFF